MRFTWYRPIKFCSSPLLSPPAFLSFFFLILTQRYILLIFLEREGGREGRKGREKDRQTSMSERNIDWLPAIHAPTRDHTSNVGRCPDREPSPQPFGVREILQPTEPPGQRTICFQWILGSFHNIQPHVINVWERKYEVSNLLFQIPFFPSCKYG